MAILTFMVFLFIFILYSAWKIFIKSGPIYKTTVSLEGKTVLITGGSSGLGKETAIGLAKQHARVIIASRNTENGQNAVLEIKSKSGNNNVHYTRLDLSDFDKVREFVDLFVINEPRLDILVNCAGLISLEETSSGEHGLMLATNILGPFLLTNLLLPLLEKTGSKHKTRIVNVASDAYLLAEVDLENLDRHFEKNASYKAVLHHYAATKLMTIYFSSELHKNLRIRERDQGLVSTFALHPGTASSNLGSSFASKRIFWRCLRWLTLRVLSRSPYFCVQTILYCCMEPGLEEHSGKYFSDMKVAELFPHAKDVSTARKLWRELEKLTGLS